MRVKNGVPVLSRPEIKTLKRARDVVERVSWHLRGCETNKAAATSMLLGELIDEFSEDEEEAEPPLGLFGQHDE